MLSRSKQMKTAKLSRSAAAKKDPSSSSSGASSGGAGGEEKKPKLEDYIGRRDWSGAVVLLEFQRAAGDSGERVLPWLGYCAFHLGDYKKAMDVYAEILQGGGHPVYHLYRACCMHHLGLDEEAEREALKGPATPLQNRLLFHLAHRRGDESKLMQFHQRLGESMEDQLSLASMQFLRSHFQDATEMYKRMLIENQEHHALQVYMALCYYKLDYYDVSLEILAPYLAKHPDSAVAANIKACNIFKLYDGAAADAELKGTVDALSSSSQSFDNDLIRHNLVVFRGGDGAMQVLPPLVDVVPEAKLNLVVCHLRNDEIEEAHELVKDMEPATPAQYILKGVVHAAMGQLHDSPQHLKSAQQLFQLVGASASEMDTIPGRQCMASCFYLLRQFEDVLVYMSSIKEYCSHLPAFNYNYGIALASTGRYAEAEEALGAVADDRLRGDYAYVSWYARSLIMAGKAREAWELYLGMESSHESFNLLLLIANDAYRVESWYYAAKAFDVLQRLDPSPDYWDGKRGACAGVFRDVVSRKANRDTLRDVVNMLHSNAASPQADLMIRIMTKWLNEHA